MVGVSSSPTRLWGLDAEALHEAAWRARGVQVVTCGGAIGQGDLYLLAPPGQFVHFDLARHADRLTWHDAAVTRVRVVDEHDEPYRERVVHDDDGLVTCIERRYTPTLYASCRVILTTQRRLAEMWAAAASPREGWKRVRGAVPWSRVDHWRVSGTVASCRETDGERRLLDRLVQTWTRPDLAIEGLEQSEDGVWHEAGRELPGDVVLVGPLWIGDPDALAGRTCLVGPDWVGDADRPEPPVTVREIADVEAPPEPAVPAEFRKRRAFFTAKRLLDIAVSATALVVLSPIMLILACAVVLEDGRPIFFGHRRQGRGGREFRCWKFRTMVRNAEQLARDLDTYNVCDGPQVYIHDDPRVTRIGKWLRHTHLDELPQLWNVLVGQMSLIGPRPSPDAENRLCPAWRETRLRVRPGITGLWQLERTRRVGEDFQEWIKYDIAYVERAGFGLDLSILLGTARMMTLGRPDSGEQ